MKTAPHTNPPSREGNPSRRSTPRHHPTPSPFAPIRGIRGSPSAFSLIELLVVIAIMATMVGLSTVAVQGFRAPAVQQAADQVMSGLSLARQTAITKNTRAALLIANQTNVGFPSEPYRHWAVVYLSRGNGTSAPGTAGGWTIAKDWEPLPNGAIFWELLNSGYNTLTTNEFNVKPGDSAALANFHTTNIAVYATANSTTPLIPTSPIPGVIFQSDGSASFGRGIRVVPGSVMGGNATITGNRSYFFIETDASIGRIRLRTPESYQTN